VAQNSHRLQSAVSLRVGNQAAEAGRTLAAPDHVEEVDTAAAAVHSPAGEGSQGNHRVGRHGVCCRVRAAVRMLVAASMVAADRTVDHTELDREADTEVGHTVQVGRTVQEAVHPGAHTEVGRMVLRTVPPEVGTACWDGEVLREPPSHPFCHNSCRYFQREAWYTRAPWSIPCSGSFA